MHLIFIEDEQGLTRVWFNGKSITQHVRGKGALKLLLLPIFAITGVPPGHKWNTMQYRRGNTMCSASSEIQLPLINVTSLSQGWRKKCISARLQKSFAPLNAFVSQELPPTYSRFKMSAGKIHLHPKVVKLSHISISFFFLVFLFFNWFNLNFVFSSGIGRYWYRYR